jgi:hypothetical protein
MAKQKVIFGEWLPDQPSITGAVTDAVNCYPVTNGYAALREAVDYSANAGQNLLVAFAGKFAGASSLFAAGATQIYKFNPSNTNLDALTTTGYSTVESWDITQFGSKMVLANGTDKLQAYDLSSSTYFADLAAAAPTARYVTVVRDFVVAASAAGEENKVYWSDINDETDWTPGAASQSDTQLIPDGGDITGLAGGEYGLIFLERAIYRMSYAGSPYFFQFDAISRTLGCISNGSIAQFGELTYFLSDDGFYVCDGKSVKNIGVEKINRWFFDNCVLGEIPTKMSATVDPVRKLVIWNFTNSFGGRYLLYYSIDLNKWSYGTTDVVSLSYGLTPSATLEQLDIYYFDTTNQKTGTYTQSSTTVTVTVTDHGLETGAYVSFDATSGAGVDGTFPITRTSANIFTFTAATSATITTSNCTITLPSIDNTAEQIPFDSRTWAGGQLIFVGVRSQRIVVFSGALQSAYVTSGDIDIGRSIITLAKPIIDNGTGTVAVASRALLTDQVEFGTASTPDSENRCGLRANGNYHRIKVSPTSVNWKTLTGCEIEIATQGTR